MTSVSKPICIDNDLPSDETSSPATSLDLWIGTGREYHDVPKLVSNELSRRLSISAASRSLLPPDHISIMQLVHYQPPHLSEANQFHTPSSYFSATLPNTDCGYLCNHPIPRHDFLNKLRGSSGQAMLDGKVLIQHWATSGIYLPFEALSFWVLLIDICDSHRIWISAKRWLETHFTASHNTLPGVASFRHFRSNWHKATAHLELPRFVHLPAVCFLYYIPAANITLSNNTLKLELTTQFFKTIYKPLADLKPLILKGIKELGSRKETTNTDN
ncbi:hypothetical protein BDN71DRAFT_1514766 [Pleurotus eryngii]|uniref:Uncharacterized protein n=1 Tax=Pleurotus eryngii TaxID=5323 RepID=A0A9P5ZHC6_PLEER|nr:hypothetical protein BDN71DRAFT_1514766 [Pleurotus eryngii]